MADAECGYCHRKLKRSDITIPCSGVCDQFYRYKCADVTELSPKTCSNKPNFG